MYMLWFKFILGLNFIFFCFKVIIIHYHTQKQKKIKFKPRIKLNHNIYLKKGGLFSILVQNSPKVTKKVLVFRKVARSCALTKKLLRILKVAKKLPSRIWKGLPILTCYNGEFPKLTLVVISVSTMPTTRT